MHSISMERGLAGAPWCAIVLFFRLHFLCNFFFLQFGSVPNAVSSHRDTPSSITIIIEYPRKFQSDANSCYRSIEKCLRSNELYFHSKIRMVVESSTDIEYIQEKSSYWMLLCIFCFLVLSGKCSKISFIHALY